ncbi:substrate-binding domain-containing protein [Kineococcus sp. T13]|nr:substrate-binding domain-containing protein [Kineococcus vitellinus]
MVASAAGVSLATVSKVIHGREDVGPRTRAEVQRLLDEQGYVPTTRRRSSSQRVTIELAFDDFMSPYATELQRGVVAAAREDDVDVIVSEFAVRGASDGERPWMRNPRAADRRGVLLVTSDIQPQQARELRVAGLPLVVIDPVHSPDEDVVSIGATNWAGGVSATEHLLALGHRRIAYIGGPDDTDVNLARLHGYRAALEKHGVAFDAAIVGGGQLDSSTGARLASTFLTRGNRPTAVFAITDLVAMGVLQAAHALGLQVPADLSVVGFDDTYVASLTTPPLTTVRTPLQEMGRVAFRTLRRLIDGHGLDSHHIELATQLVVRSSTARPLSERQVH